MAESASGWRQCGDGLDVDLRFAKAHFDIRLAGRIDPRPKPAAADEIAIAVIEQRPILQPTRFLSVDLGVEFLLEFGFSELAAAINERGNGGIAPQFHRKEQILDLP